MRRSRPSPASPTSGRLRLEENAITDAAAEDIAGLKDLTYLNLTNAKVTDAGFAVISTLPKLSRVYIWETAVTPAAVDKVKALCKDVTIYAGLTAKDVPVETSPQIDRGLDEARREGECVGVRPCFSEFLSSPGTAIGMSTARKRLRSFPSGRRRIAPYQR
jgi:hypothetical protein